MEMVGDGLESEDYVYRLKLFVFVEEDFWLMNPIKVCKVH